MPANSVVVDVGGGIGSQAMVLAQSFNHLKFIVQDRKEAIEDAKKVRSNIVIDLFCWSD